MDPIIASALEEICAKGQTGLSLASLWSRIGPSLSSSNLDLSPGVKKSVWNNLLNVSTLQFHAKSLRYSSDHPAIRSFEDAEKLNLKIVAEQHLRDNFVGLYDQGSAHGSISSNQRRVLERLAIARANGVTQSELSKEFGIEGNNMFYVTKNLECRGLIVRPDAIVRTKEAGEEGDLKNNASIASTKLLYLYRYAQHLSSQQRFEIIRGEQTLDSPGNGDESDAGKDDFARGGVKDDVCVKDYLPQMKAVCDKLEGANGKVLVVSDIKQDLGYIGSCSGHRAWRNICNRLRHAHIVEEFEAKVNDKAERCLRLLKKFSSNIDLKSHGSVDEKFDGNPLLNFGRNQRTDQLVDLSIEHQVYDMIDAEGSHGILGRELASRLGISHKRNQARLENMSSRFGAVMQAETVKKSKAYRFWTHGNLNRQSSAVHPCKTKSLDVINISNVNDENKDASDTSTNYFLECDPSASEGDFPTPEKVDQTEVKIAIPHIHDDGMANNEFLCSGNPQELLTDPRGTVPDAEVDVFSMEMEMQASPSERTPPTSAKPRKSRSTQRYPCQSTIDSTRREQRILERLKDEKFILKSELYRWLMNFEMDKGTTMDRKTIDRIVSKLQQEGHCKYIKINVPVVSNCGGSRIITAILHPSVQSLLPELHGEIHDRLRSFEMQSRGHGSTKWKNNESLPVLNNIKRTASRVYSDSQAVRSEAMRANGFVFPKMVRTKLLHSFLWSYLSSSPGWDDALSSGKHFNDLKNHITACNLFSLEEAIKAIPLELFLQVAGSTKKIDDIAEKCKRGLRLSDLPVHDYKHLMDTMATGRLSKIIDILRRLKLIRLVTNGHSDVGVKVPHTTFTHAFELKPYIEEPQSFVSTFSNSRPLDLRPHIRHDFILSSKKAVDEYWQTLEFCYAAIDPRTALHAFPGSSVHEVFVSRSWALVQAMTADQRVELLRQIEKVNLDQKFTFKECEKIAKDLNLTIEQVLRVYYDKRQKRINRFQGALNTSGDDLQLVKGNRASSSRKRKRSVNARMVKRTNVDPQAAELSDNVNKFGEHNPSIAPVEQDVHLGACQEDETVQEPCLNEDEECRSIINKHALKRTRQKRFPWTDEADRQLLMQYVRYRVTLGPQFQRTSWTSLPDLPGPPTICRKRMFLLNSNSKFRRAVMRLCNVLSERYVKYLERNQNRSVCMEDQRELIGSSSVACHNKCFSDGVQRTQEYELKEEHWDDFDDTNIKMALEEVLWHKQMAKLESSKRVRSFSDWSDQNINSKEDPQESDLVSVSTPRDDIPDHTEEPKDSADKSRSRRVHQKFIKRLNEGTNSLAIASAVELLKLVFLSTSALPEVPNLLAETLRRYSEHDLFTAFSYLSEKKFMVGGDDKPFVLSQHFLQRVSTSPFPTKTGERAAKFSSWLHEREKDLIEGTIDLTADLQCGDIFHLFALVSSDELSLCPCLPDEGVGEAEDLRVPKRKSDNNEYYDCNKAKKLKSLNDAELISRREKGFPGIMVSVNRTAFSIANVVDFFKDREPSATDLLIDWNDKSNTILRGNFCSIVSCDDRIDIPGVQNVVSLTGSSSESLWEVMTSFADRLMLKPQERVSPLYPELFQAVYTSIQKAGDQGLSIGEVYNVVDVPGETIPDLVIDVLQAFGRALKVNAHNSVRVVDGLYRSKYLLTTNTGFGQDHEPPSIIKTTGSTDDDCLTEQPEDCDTSTASPEIGSLNVDTVHKVTILNLPEGVPAPLSEIPSSVVQDGYMLDIFAVPKGGKPHKSSFVDMPILPWMNIDGTVNKSVFKGLTRRVLGIVMQNPGILEDDIIFRMDVLNPQSCRTLLNLMILDKHLMRRKMLQSVYCRPPSLLGALSGNVRKPKFICREHYFANPMSTSLL